MKTHVLSIFCLLFACMMISCGEDQESKNVKDAARESLGLNKETAPPPVPATQPNPAAQSQAQNINPNVPHYKCPNDCEGSGGPSAGTCPVCGTDYVHNAAYHSTPATSATNTATGNQTTVSPSTNTAPPGQNANGVWHYTCPEGCEGGAAGAGSCANCGATLAHNAAYHN